MGDPSRRQRLGRILKELGLIHVSEDAKAKGQDLFPRILVRRPQRGFFHPASRADLRHVLEVLGPEAVYGLKTVELARAPDVRGSNMPSLGRLEVPGGILLYEQPVPPWRLTGTISRSEADRCRRAGAEVTIRDDLEATFLDWPGQTLRRFMLLDVFLHELGHHVLQHTRTDQARRIARTRDHESFAELFAQRCLDALAEEMRWA